MQKTRWLLNGIVMICFMDLFVQLPVMGPFAQSLGAGSFQIGLAVGLYSLTNMLGNMIAGIWIDRFGGKPILLTGLLLTASIILLYPLVQQPTHLLMVRVLHGLSGGLLVPSAFTLVSRYASGRGQGRSMALSGAAVGVAAIVGPASAGILKASVGLDRLFMSLSGLLVMGAILVWVGAPKSTKGKEEEAGSIRVRESRSAFLAAIRQKSVIQSYFGAFSLMFAMGALTFSLPLKVDALGFPVQTAGMMLSVFGVVAICMFLLPTNRMFDQGSPLKLSLAGGLLVIISLFALSLMQHRIAMFGVMAVYGLGFALLFPSLNALLVKHIASEHKGKAFGLFYAFFSLGVVAGSSGVGAFTENYDTALRIAAIFLLLSCGLLIVWQFVRSGRRIIAKS
ncbi:MFS transporter [Paenibacillus senegalimassiliensis]|uniref:MFS transporter n=1 Tax=Paenibacillus senegalimassiliensis TaxID=1737426 RepID=UPI000B23669E|nr:MFS transporter [Paenibacillus senegalimassiliensis]